MKLWVSFLFDWIVVLALAAIAVAVFFSTGPANRFIFPNDPSFSYPLVPETVPNWLLYVFVIILPFVVVGVTLLVELLLRRRSGVQGSIRSFAFELHHALLHFAFLFVCIVLIVQTLKVWVGFYRPNFFALGSDRGRVSWPSGHSALSCGMLLFLSLFCAGKFKLFSVFNSLWLFCVCFSPMVLAVFISASRVVNYYHSPADVVTGMFFGVLLAVGVYSVGYEPLSHPDRSGLPFSRFGKTTETEEPIRI
jgi:membrane-associated phospholipid phosphatase